MRRILLSLFVICSACYISAQVTTEPAFIKKGYSDTILINFNPNEGNKGMASAKQCYAHIGLITSASSSNSDWKYAPKWRGGEAKYKMNKVGEVWQLVIPNIYTYFGCPETVEIKRIALVFNDGPNGTLEGKSADGSDIFVDLVGDGLFVDLQPSGDMLKQTGETITFIGNASDSAFISLQINEQVVVPYQKGVQIKYSYTFEETGVYNVSFKAVADTLADIVPVSDVASIVVVNPVEETARPEGMQAGISYPNNHSANLCLYAGSKTQPAQNVFVVGDFNNWQVRPEYQMKRDGFWFWINIDGLAPGVDYAFQYKVIRADGIVKHISDPYSTKLLHPDDRYEPKKVDPTLKSYPTASEADGGYVTVINTQPKEYKWSDATLNFVRPDKNNLVIYELWIYDYTPSRSIAGLMDMLDYIEGLGVNAIELMPICEFDGNYNWGYSPNHYFAPDKAYGSALDYKKLIDECHKRGMAVILDMVFNHATGLNPQNKLYPYGDDLAQNPYFNVNAPHSDNVYEDWNHDFEPAREMFTRALNYWIQEYHVDGYRMDLSHGFCGATCSKLMSNLSHYYQNGVLAAEDYSEKGEPYFILEHWGADMGSQRPQLVKEGMMCWNNTSDAYSQLAMGWISNDDLTQANQKGYVSYCESHDEERNFYKVKAYGNGSVKTNYLTEGLSRIPITRAFSVLLQGPQMMYQYSELGYDYSINSTKGSSSISENNRTSIKEQPISLGWLEDKTRMAAYDELSQVIKLRTKIRPDIFTKGSVTRTKLGSGALKSFTWTLGADRIVVVGNFNVEQPSNQSETFSPEQTYAPFPLLGVWYDYLANSEIMVNKSDYTITLAPGEYRIFTSFPIVDPIEGVDVVEANNVRVYPTATENKIHIDMQDNSLADVTVFNIQGQLCGQFSQTNEISMSSLPAGVYMLKVETSENTEMVRVIKR